MTHAGVADILVVLHLVWATFMVCGFLLAVGSIWRAAWRRLMFVRTAHLVGIVITATAPLWSGMCPVTIWESKLRLADGLEAIPKSFLAYYADRILYLDVPVWAITVATSVVAIGSASLYVIFPPWKERAARNPEAAPRDREATSR